MAARAALGLIAVGASAAACAGTPPPPVATVRAVSAVVLVNRCASLGPVNARLAESAISKLVDGCAPFSGGRVRFTAILLPGGAIQFEPGADRSEAIPVCVLSHPLAHGVHLQKSCALDVALESSAMALPGKGDAGS
jgi:hypothetical protein